MFVRLRWTGAALFAAACVAGVAPVGGSVGSGARLSPYAVHRLVSDGASVVAGAHDPALVDGWGLAAATSGAWWACQAGSVAAAQLNGGGVAQAPERVGEATEAGALVQVTAAAVDGRFGRREQSTARALIRSRRAHLIASDGHAPSIRKIGMSAACEALGDDELAHWLTVGVPGAIVTGTPLPKRPASPRLPFRRLMHQG